MFLTADELTNFYNNQKPVLEVYLEVCSDMLRLVKDASAGKETWVISRGSVRSSGEFRSCDFDNEQRMRPHSDDYKGLCGKYCITSERPTSQIGALKALQMADEMVLAKYRSIMEQSMLKPVSDNVIIN